MEYFYKLIIVIVVLLNNFWVYTLGWDHDTKSMANLKAKTIFRKKYKIQSNNEILRWVGNQMMVKTNEKKVYSSKVNINISIIYVIKNTLLLIQN